MAVDVEKDRKGGAYIVSHLRCGYHECIWLSDAELKELRGKLDAMELFYGVEDHKRGK